jgi:hypothetical protein
MNKFVILKAGEVLKFIDCDCPCHMEGCEHCCINSQSNENPINEWRFCPSINELFGIKVGIYGTKSRSEVLMIITSLKKILEPVGIANMPENNLREKLAELEHKQWAHWYRYMVANLTPENRKRWDGQAATPYALLTEVEKNCDREWADKVLEIFKLTQDETDSIKPE